MLSGRTRVLFALSSLAPASILTWRLYVAAVVTGYKERGELTGFWADPGYLFYVFLFVGFISFVFAILSMVVDLRRSPENELGPTES
jgi:hypothetical protein